MTNQEWILSASEQADIFPPAVVADNPFDKLFAPQPINPDDWTKPTDYYQRSPVQRELFDLDPDNDSDRTAFFAQFSRPIADHFARQLARRIKTYGTSYGTQWFKEQQAKQLERVKLVMAQYADIVGILEMQDNLLSWANELPVELFAKDTLKATACSCFPDLVERLKQGKRLIKEAKLRPLCYLKPNQLKQIATTICDHLNDHANRRGDQLAHLATNKVTAKALLMTIYQELIAVCELYQIPAPNQSKASKGSISDEELQSAFLKITDPKYWQRKLNTLAKRQREHLSIAVGMVHAVTGGYVSHERLMAYEEQRKANYQFIKNCIITNVLNEEEQHELLDIWLKTNANPKINRIEMMTRLRGYEEWADHYGLEGVFVTLTAPSKYHAALKDGGINPKWAGFAPHHTQKYLCNVWAKVRSSLSRQNIDICGLRVAEPHHDATPHFHFVLWTTPARMKELKATLYRYALEVDGDEKGARLRRCRFMKIDKEKGSATAYLAKYVSKNIDGQAMDDLLSDETGRKTKESAVRAKAWATLWGIRQFQFIGGSNIGSWRELRRLGDVKQADPLIDTGRAVCNVSDFAAYMQFQGGAFVKRAEQKIRLHYIETELNSYLERRKKINGVINTQTNQPTKTRLKEWVIGKKAKDWHKPSEEASQEQQRQQDELALKNAGLPALGLVSVTVRAKKSPEISPQLREQIKQQVIIQRGRVTEHQIDDLLNGKPLGLGTFNGVKLSLRYANGQLIEEKHHIYQ